MKFLKLILAFLLASSICWGQKLDLGNDTKGNLPLARFTPGSVGQCLETNISGSAVWTACPAGTVTTFSAGNLAPLFTCSVSNPTTTPSLSCTPSTVAAHKYLGNNTGTPATAAFFQPVSTELADFSPTAPTTAGKIPIFDPTAANAAGGTGAYVPGDPLVQGLFADGSTSVANPLAIGGYDTAGTPALHRAIWINTNPSGTEYGEVVRTIPSGTQVVSGTVAVSNFPSSFSVSNFPATQPVSATSLPLPSGAATSAKQPALGTAGTPSTDVITIQGASAGTAVKVDGSAVTQPVSIGTTVNVNCASGCTAGGSFTDNSAFTAGTTAEGNVGGVFNDGLTAVTSGNAAAVRITAQRGEHVNLRNNSGTEIGTSTTPLQVSLANTATNSTAVKVDGSAVTQPVSASALPLPSGAATSANQSTVKAASTQATTTDTSQVVQINPNQPQLTTPLNVQGAKSDNSAAPGSTNLGVLPALANAAPPSKTEGNEAALSMDLAGNIRVYGHPPNVLGCYVVNQRTGTYTGLSSGAILFSMRWSSSTSFAIIQRVKVNVITSTAATAAGEAERELHIVRSFTVADTGGTAVTLTGNNAKLRTSFATSAVADMRFGQPLTAGTGTADANAVSSAVAWLPLNFTGVDIGCGGASTTTAAWSCAGGIGAIDLLNATNGQEYPIILAQNEGIRITIGKDGMPSSAVQQTTGTIEWCEVSAY